MTTDTYPEPAPQQGPEGPSDIPPSYPYTFSVEVRGVMTVQGTEQATEERIVETIKRTIGSLAAASSAEILIVTAPGEQLEPREVMDNRKFADRYMQQRAKELQISQEKYQLTDREVTIIEYVGRDMSDATIVEILRCSRRKLRTDIRAIEKKMGVGSRAAMIATYGYSTITAETMNAAAKGLVEEERHRHLLTERRKEWDLDEQSVAIIGCVASGLSNKQIGEKLIIGSATVKTRLGRIRKAMGIDEGPNSRTEIVVHYHGLVEPKQ